MPTRPLLGNASIVDSDTARTLRYPFAVGPRTPAEKAPRARLDSGNVFFVLRLNAERSGNSATPVVGFFLSSRFRAIEAGGH